MEQCLMGFAQLTAIYRYSLAISFVRKRKTKAERKPKSHQMNAGRFRLLRQARSAPLPT